MEVYHFRPINPDLSHFTSFAALTIQRYVRGHQCRLELWSPYGKLTQRRAVKIQRTWRGLLGRRAGFKQWIWYRNYKASIIQGLCIMWHAKRYIRKLRAEHYNKCITMLQTAYRGRLGRRSFAEFKFMVYTKMSKRIQMGARGRQGRRRYKCIKERMCGMTGAYGQITDALKSDYVRSEGYKKKITIEDQNVGGLDKWQLHDAVLSQLLGTHRQHIAIDMATILTRKYPDFTMGILLLFISLYFNWCSYGPQKVIREDILGEALEVLEDLKERRSDLLRRPIYKDEQDDIPYMLRGEDPVSYHYGNLIDELEYSWFGGQFKRHGVDPYTMCLKASFLVAKATLYCDDHIKSNDAIEKAHRYFQLSLDKTRNLKEDLYLRNQVFESIFNNKEEFIGKCLCTKNIKMDHAFLDKYEIPSPDAPPRKIDKSAAGGAKLAKKPRVHLTMSIYQYGDLIIIKGVFDDLEKIKQSIKNLHMTWDDLGYKWRKAMYVRPMVIFPSDIRGLEERSLVHLGRSLKKKRDELLLRTLHHNVGEYLIDTCRLLGAKTRCSSAFRGIDPMEFVPELRSPITYGTEFSHSRLAFPFLEYRHSERNLTAVEDYMIRMIQRAFLGFKGRALFRRLWWKRVVHRNAMKFTADERERYRIVRMRRYNSCMLIQSRFRGYRWRLRLFIMTYSALRVQTRFRVYKAQCWYYEERRRLALGPEVIEMMRRGVEISDRKMVLVVYRCGNNYKVLGEDLLNNLRYDGHVYAPEVKELLDEHNYKIEERLGKDTPAAKAEKVNIWQQGKVAEFISNNLALTQMIIPVTRELGIGKRDTKLCLVLLKTAHGRGIQHNSNLKRILDDRNIIMKDIKRLKIIKKKFVLKKQQEIMKK